MGRRDSIGLLSLDTLCLGLFLECDSTRRVGVVFFFFGVSWEEGELFGLARVICRIARKW